MIVDTDHDRRQRAEQLARALRKLRLEPNVPVNLPEGSAGNAALPLCRHGQQIRECQDCRPEPARPRPKRGSAAEMILDALRCSGAATFSREQIIVTAWEYFPADFALPGYALPDATKVCCALFGRRGMIARGYLVRLPDGRFQLAEEVTVE